MRRVLSLAVVALVGAVLFYVSRFWDFRLWDREGLFGIEALSPGGGLLARWLRGTDFAVYELLVWVVGAFLLLTLLEKLLSLFGNGSDHD